MNSKVLLIFFTIYSIAFSDKDHKCIRNCQEKSQPMICKYDWQLETYSTLSRACFNCPKNYTDCLREDCILADGVLKTIEIINRQLPGPYIQVCKGDTVVVNVHNKMRSERVSSIHWHGLKQKGSQNMDGVGMITQWPILPHTSFRYEFIANDSGTHFWHAHSGIQRSEGVFGAFIVRDKDDENKNLYDFDLKDHYMILIEWTLNPLQSIYGSYLHSALYGTEHSILINGKSRLDSRHDLKVPLETYYVKKGFRYRFRLISSAVQNCLFKISIDNHNMTIIATDGQSIEPINVESLTLISGERYDIVIEANKTEKDYWIKVKGEKSCSKMFQTAILRYENGEFLKVGNLPVLKYEDADRIGIAFRSVPDSFNDSSVYSVNDLRHPKGLNDDYFKRISEKVDKVFFLNFDHLPENDGEIHKIDLYPFEKSIKQWKSASINGIKFEMPSLPPVLYWNEMNKTNFCNQTNNKCSNESNKLKFCTCTHFLEFKLNDLIELVLIDGNFFHEYHPIHLHGYTFAVVGMGKFKEHGQGLVTTEYVKKLDQNGELLRNFDRPVIKDTISMPKGGYAIVRLIADNPGFWLLHCHIDTHSDIGMTILIKVE